MLVNSNQTSLSGEPYMINISQMKCIFHWFWQPLPFINQKLVIIISILKLCILTCLTFWRRQIILSRLMGIQFKVWLFVYCITLVIDSLEDYDWLSLLQLLYSHVISYFLKLDIDYSWSVKARRNMQITNF